MIRILLLILGVATVAGALLSLSGVLPGLIYLLPWALIYLLLYGWRLQEHARDKKKAPGRSARPGA